MNHSKITAFTVIARFALVIPLLFILIGLMRPAGPETADQPPSDLTLAYTLDRSAVPPLTYTGLTLKIYIGTAASVRAVVDGVPVPITYNPQSGYAMITTSGTELEVTARQVHPTSRLGEVSKTALKNDARWAWSHGFDDNVLFKEKGIPAFEAYGWRATVYIIGSKLSDTRDENWIIDRPDLIKLVKKGWAIGNHSWSHDTVEAIGGPQAAAADIARLDTYLRGLVTEAGRPNYRLISFAAPDFDSQYLPVLLGLRGSHTTGLLFDESGSSSFIRVDSGAAEPPNTLFTVFDPNNAIGREYRIDEFGTGSDFDKSFRHDLATMISSLDDTHHYWLNTFTHDVDGKAPKTSIFAFLPWVDQNYGPHGDRSVWVAPAEEIYSYLLVRDGVKVTYGGTFLALAGAR